MNNPFACARGAVTAAVLALAAGACSTGGPSVTSYVHEYGAPDKFAYAAGGRDMKVEVIGNPFSQPKDQFDRTVADAMQGKNHGPVTNFTPSPGESARDGYRMVVMFNPPRALNTTIFCGDPAELMRAAESASDADTADGGVARATMAFCAKDRLVSEASGTAPVGTSPSEDSFPFLVAALTRKVVPRQDPYALDNNCDMPMAC